MKRRKDGESEFCPTFEGLTTRRAFASNGLTETNKNE